MDGRVPISMAMEWRRGLHLSAVLEEEGEDQEEREVWTREEYNARRWWRLAMAFVGVQRFGMWLSGHLARQGVRRWVSSERRLLALAGAPGMEIECWWTVES